MGGRGSNSGLKNSNSHLGRRGKPKDMDTALAATNPHYREGKEWQQNCQRCVFAYEMQRRGYDVEAMPRIFDGTDELPYAHAKGGWMNVMEGAKMVDMPSRKTLDKMLEQMSEWGDGARAIVNVTWKGERSGHVFIAEHHDIATSFLDPQTGRYVDVNSYLSAAIKGRTKLVRIDNLKPTALIEKCVRKRGTTNDK